MKKFSTFLIFLSALAMAIDVEAVPITTGDTAVLDPTGQPGTRYPNTGVSGIINFAVLGPGDPLYSTLASGFNPGTGSPSTLAAGQYIYLYEVINTGPWEIWSMSLALGNNLGTLTSLGFVPLSIPGNTLSPPSSASGTVPTDGPVHVWGYFSDGYRFTDNGNDISQTVSLQAGDAFGIDVNYHGNRDNFSVSITGGTNYAADFSFQNLDLGDGSMIVGFTSPNPPTGVPDGGSTAELIGMTMLALGALRGKLNYFRVGTECLTRQPNGVKLSDDAGS